MNGDESLHITVKKPPDPNPIRTIGVFDDPQSPVIGATVEHFLSNCGVPKDLEFIENVKDEVLKLLSTHSIVAVAREGKLVTVYLNDNSTS